VNFLGMSMDDGDSKFRTATTKIGVTFNPPEAPGRRLPHGRGQEVGELRLCDGGT